MDTYLAICITVLILTQVIRLIQNTIQLRRQGQLFKAQLGQLSDITEEDMNNQRAFYRAGLKYFQTMLAKVGEE